MSTSPIWSQDAYFDSPEPESVDGGTTSHGDLWHTVSSRWGHAMHAMCSYYGMFPAKVAHYFIQRYSLPGDLVVDPFSGRGTTALQARMEGRRAICNDLSPLAFVLSSAKVAPPGWRAVNAYVDELEQQFRFSAYDGVDVSEDIRMLYHDNTLRQLVYLRERLLSTPVDQWSPNEFMVGGALAGIMHGGWRRDGSSQYLSISMPNTFSMSPSYVAKYIAENGLQKLDQDVFERLRDKLARLYLDDYAGEGGQTFHQDAVELLMGSKGTHANADLIVTSPPYLGVVNYGASNWIRLWLLGIDGVSRDQGAGRKRLDAALDHSHTYATYRDFMLRTLHGVERSLKRDGVAVLVIGDVAESGKRPVPLAANLWDDVKSETNLRLLELVEDDLPTQNKVSRIWGETKGQATNRDCALILTHADGDPDLSRTEIDWSEPYRDGGPDAAHDRLRRNRAR
ncbi:DNA methyltransferase [Cellulomonas humilata]|uniref:site-specific DNA-methyltransferase (cytosine-N(4)-specific) n=1 Tax=Cellulomonas humilata TaxID=144055 RepID=A0ABU0ELA4_9CELL|nr:DNA methyltransferase [Cellulomonas humilata]MDQ0375969.1 site-specific DNA-methyltransferase (adenine-specific) [Cellulomonas humilata]